MSKLFNLLILKGEWKLLLFVVCDVETGKSYIHKCQWNLIFYLKRGSSVVRHLPLMLEVPGSIPAHGEENFGV